MLGRSGVVQLTEQSTLTPENLRSNLVICKLYLNISLMILDYIPR